MVDGLSDSSGDEMDYTVLEKPHLHKFHLHRSVLKRTFARIGEVYQSDVDGRN